MLVIFCKIYGANVARKNLEAFYNLYMQKSWRNIRFAILWSNWSRYSRSQSAQVCTCIENRRINCAFITRVQ